MAFVTDDRMVFCWNNRLTAENVTDIDFDGFTEVAGHPVENLLQPDPSLYLSTNTPTAHPAIRVEFSSPMQVKALGVLAHNLYGYTAARLDYGASMTGPWTQIHAENFPPLPLNQHPNFILRNTATSSQWFRVLFTHSTWTAFRIGGLYLFGESYEADQNTARDNGYVRTRLRPSKMRRAAGGAKHRVRGPKATDEELLLLFNRISQNQMGKLSEIEHQTGSDDTVGIVGPEQAKNTFPKSGTGHFFGTLTGLTSDPSGGADGVDSHRYNVTATLEGVE